MTPSPSPRDRRFPPQALANEVRTELAASGLPILPPEYDVLTEQASGVSIEGDEEGVWVSWEVHGPLTEASQRAFQVAAWRPGNPDGFDGHPAMKHCAVSRGSMTEVLATILRSLGYGVQADADEYRVGELLVSPRRWERIGEIRPCHLWLVRLAISRGTCAATRGPVRWIRDHHCQWHVPVIRVVGTAAVVRGQASPWRR